MLGKRDGGVPSRDGQGLLLCGTTEAAAQFFRLLAFSGQKTPFFDEHSLDSQRFYNVMCLVSF
jgi:hypothetical protein